MRRAAVVLCVAALLATGGPQRVGAASGGTLRIVVTVTPRTLNPILTTTVVQNFLSGIFNDRLVQTAPDGQTEAKLAREVPTLGNGGISRDGLTITYHLRPNVRWQDGVAFTSADVRFTWSAVMNPNNNVTNRAGYQEIARLDTPDPLTVVLHLKKRYAPIVAQFVSEAKVLPEHLLAKERELNDIPFNGKPVGVGPYRVVRWDRGSQIEFAANGDYYLGKPLLSRVIVKIIPDENTAMIQLKTHEVDWLYDVSPGTYAQLRREPGVLGFLQKQNDSLGVTVNTSRPPLDDVRVRRALSLAVNRKTIVDKVNYGTADPSTGGDLPSYSWAYDPATKPVPYDPVRARQLLTEAGWVPGSDGIATKDGRRLSLTLVYSAGRTARQQISVLVQSMLRDIGVEVVLKAVDAGMLFASYAQGGLLQRGEFDLDLSGFVEFDDPDDSLVFSCKALPPNGFDSSRYCTRELDRLQGIALGSYDPAVRKRAYARIQALIANDVPEIVLSWERIVHVYRVGVRNIEIRPGILSPFFQKWSV